MSLEMAPLDKSHTSSFSASIVTMAKYLYHQPTRPSGIHTVPIRRTRWAPCRLSTWVQSYLSFPIAVNFYIIVVFDASDRHTQLKTIERRRYSDQYQETSTKHCVLYSQRTAKIGLLQLLAIKDNIIDAPPQTNCHCYGTIVYP